MRPLVAYPRPSGDRQFRAILVVQLGGGHSRRWHQVLPSASTPPDDLEPFSFSMLVKAPPRMADRRHRLPVDRQAVGAAGIGGKAVKRIRRRGSRPRRTARDAGDATSVCAASFPKRAEFLCFLDARQSHSVSNFYVAIGIWLLAHKLMRRTVMLDLLYPGRLLGMSHHVARGAREPVRTDSADHPWGH
jgi:hypothetical protein